MEEAADEAVRNAHKIAEHCKKIGGPTQENPNCQACTISKFQNGKEFMEEYLKRQGNGSFKELE